MANKKKKGGKAAASNNSKNNNNNNNSNKNNKNNKLTAEQLQPAVSQSKPVADLLGSLAADDAEILEFFCEEVSSQLAKAEIVSMSDLRSETASHKLSGAVQHTLEFLADYDIEGEPEKVENALRAALSAHFGADEEEEEAGKEQTEEENGSAQEAAEDGVVAGADSALAESRTLKKKERRAAKKGKGAAGAASASSAASEDLVPEAPKRPKGFVSILDRRRKGLDSMSNDIKVEKFDLGFNRNVLFSNANLALNHGHKYGLVAANGLGKSTLLRAIAARENEFENIPSHFDIHYCEQEVVADDTPALTKVIQADTERLRLLEEEKMMMEDDDLYDGELLQRLHDRLDEIEADSAEGRASAILSGLQFTEEMKQQPTKDFSGGWRMRIALACALFRRPTLLLLDEPTNHLDLLAVIWLDNYLQKWKNTLLIVSHDQDFLNSVCSDIMHIEDQKLYYYKGAYDKFKHQHEEKLRADYKAWEAYEKARKAEKAQRGKKDNKKVVAQKAAKNIKAIQDKHQAAKRGTKKGGADPDDDKPETVAPQRPREYRVKFEFPEPSELSIPIIQVVDAKFGYTPEKVLFEDLDFGIDQQSRICLAGPNGCGKTTLLKLMWGELQPVEGQINVNRHLIVGKYSQHAHEQLDLELTPIEYLLKKYGDIPEIEGMGQQQAQQFMRKMLGRFGLSGETHTRTIGSLSGGQKARVALAEICLQKPHILFFDEPTNHLDIESIDALIDGLNAFDGGVIVVSHDARLITEVCSDLWIVGHKAVTIFNGDFDDYREQLVEEFEERERALEEQRLAMQEDRRRKREEERARREKQMAEIKQQKAAGKK